MEETAGYEERFSLGLEDVASYRDFFSAEEWDSLDFGEWDPPEEPPPVGPAAATSCGNSETQEQKNRTSLPEGDALRLAMALEDYELVTVIDIGGSKATGFWIAINDHRFDIDYEICSHADYWDFISYFAAGQMWPVKPYPKTHQVSITVSDDDGYELTCAACDFNDHVSDRTEADSLKRLHEAFVATLVERYDIAS